MLTKIFGPLIQRSPALKRTIWRRWYEFLAGGYTQDDWTFMNYGFGETDPAATALPLEPSDETDRFSIQLYHRVVGGVDLNGLDVLEVGSGRGGGSSYVARYLRPKSVLGVDYSDKAVELSEKRHSVCTLRFAQGDAEALPCADGAFDAVLNVESSHCYGSMEKFLSEVYRVLRPGGYFLWADMRGPNDIENTCKQFEDAGLNVIARTDITPNVVNGLDHVTERKQSTINRHVPRFLRHYFADFAGIPGTRVYESLRNGNVGYWCCAMQKPPAG
jgi:ubiquinone/menaquinone biosynthesis C-methylase UbiE